MALKDTGLDKGAQIGRYVIVESVGSGAMGVVYGAYDPELDRKVALKLLKPGHHGAKETARERLLREAKAMARLQHPNVVAVHDVGVFEGQVFLAMEFLSAGTIKSWLAEKPRAWREIVRVFAAAGRGLAAAHAAGIVHRDFKPDNVLLDKEGRPRVVDFGIAREADGAADSDGRATLRDGPRPPDDAAADAEAGVGGGSGSRPLLTLTKTGALIGTPAYMAPEQFMGERGEERSDQFSFCVALYEALYGERPFAGDDMLSISVNVTQGELRPLPKDRGVPAWIRRVIVRGLRANPAARWPSMAALIQALEDDPAAKLRRRIVGASTVVVVVGSLLVAGTMVSRRRREGERAIAQHLEQARAAVAAARASVARARDLRTRSFAAFDVLDRETGESLWQKTQALLPAIDRDYDRAAQELEAAFMLDSSRGETRSELADARYEQFLFAEDFRVERRAQILAERLASLDVDGSRRKAMLQPGSLVVRTQPAATIRLERYDVDPTTGRRTLKALGSVQPSQTREGLAPGSYRLAMAAAGAAPVMFPFEVGRGERVSVDLRLPPAAAVPDGFVYVPPGAFWFGDGDEQLRSQFLGTVPIHRRKTDAFLIARHETTYADWIAFLDAQQEAEQGRHQPAATATSHGSLRLRRTDDGTWQLTLEPADARYVARLGESITYVGRKQRARQDWRQFPVAGISVADVESYLAWLRKTRRAPGARLCTELEWERAARGADDRLYPHGDELAPDDADFDATYGRVSSAYGPDAVGSHPASRSPFEVDDLAGNVWEVVTSSQKRDELVIRGGAYYFNAISARSTNRELVPATVADVTTGVRVCSSLEEAR